MGFVPVPAALTQWHAAQLRRALLRAARSDAVLQDQIDAAELSLVCGAPDVARMLYGLIFLQVGFSPAGLRFQQEVEARTGLWSRAQTRERERDSPPAGFCVDVAIAELRRLMALQPALGAPARIEEVLPPELVNLGAPGSASEAPDEALRARVMQALGAVLELEAEGTLSAVLRELAVEIAALPPIRLEDRIDETPNIAASFALLGLRRFILTTYDLLDVQPPTGVLFDEAARLDPAALGPYFSNVRRLLRNASDLFAIIELASDGTAGDAEIQLWCVLLSGFFQGDEVLHLIDELGDRGMTDALRRLLVRTARWTPVERRADVVWRIRDAALDIGEYPLAIEAQQLVAYWTPSNRIEWSILGEIKGTLGDKAGAEEAFARCLVLDPDDGGAKDRLRALRSNAFARFEVKHGFGTNPGRARIRRARAEAYKRRGRADLVES